MVRWPPVDRMSKVSGEIVEKFKKTAGAKDLEQDPREWVLVNWPWMPDPPYSITVRASDGEERQLLADEDGVWRLRRIRPGVPPRAA
jgi:hypothetical protein